MPRRRSPAESLFASFKKHVVTLQVGKPQPVPGDKKHDWFCPVYVEGWTPHVVPAIGIGPFDSLMNALLLVRSFREHIADMHITERPASRIRRR